MPNMQAAEVAVGRDMHHMRAFKRLSQLSKISRCNSVHKTADAIQSHSMQDDDVHDSIDHGPFVQHSGTHDIDISTASDILHNENAASGGFYTPVLLTSEDTAERREVRGQPRFDSSTSRHVLFHGRQWKLVTIQSTARVKSLTQAPPISSLKIRKAPFPNAFEILTFSCRSSNNPA